MNLALTVMNVGAQLLGVALLFTNAVSLAVGWPYVAALGLLLVSAFSLFLQMLMLSLADA